MILVMDASAIVAMLKNEPGGLDIVEIMDNLGNTCCIHAVNLCEIYYELPRLIVCAA